MERDYAHNYFSNNKPEINFVDTSVSENETEYTERFNRCIHCPQRKSENYETSFFVMAASVNFQ